MTHKISIFFSLIYCISILISNYACNRQNHSFTNANDFLLNDLQGNRFYLSAQKGKIVILNFWSVQCVPCIKEMPELEKFSQILRDKNCLVIGVCNTPSKESLIESILEKAEVTYTNLMDNNSMVSHLYGVKELPTTFIIDHNGKIRYKSTGYRKNNLYILKKITEQLINERNNSK